MSEIVIFESKDEKIKIEVNLENETVWLTRQQIADLFERDVKTIGKHINNAFNDDELDKSATVANFAIVQKEGSRSVNRKIEHYSLDVIISVGYRVKSKRGIQFRQWATKVLKDHLVKGYTINRNVVGDIKTITGLLAESHSELKNRVKNMETENNVIKNEIKEISKALKESQDISQTLKGLKKLLG